MFHMRWVLDVVKNGDLKMENLEARNITPAKEAERCPKEYLELVTEEYMKFINIFSEG